MKGAEGERKGRGDRIRKGLRRPKGDLEIRAVKGVGQVPNS